MDDSEMVLPGQEPGNAAVRLVRRYPATCAGLTLLVLYLFGLRTLLGGGQIVGVEVAPWPDLARDFLRAYASSWTGDPVGSAAFASPVQAVLGLVSVLGFGSAWLAQRLVLFGLLPLAWVFALRAGRLVTPRPAPRILGATLYVLSPVVLGALGQGRFGTLVAAALLPGVVLVAIRTADPTTPLATAWRSSALLALGLALTCAAEPGLAPAVVFGFLGVLVASRRVDRSGQATVRLAVGGGAGLLLLSPWLAGLVRGGTVGTQTAAPLEQMPLWRALAAAPEVLPAFAGVGGLRSVVTAAAVLTVGILLGLRTKPAAVAGLVAAVGLSGLLAWGATRAGVTLVWTPALLLPAAFALAGLGVIAARTLTGGLRQYAFGTRQLAVVVAVVALTVGLAGGVLRLASGPWDGLTRDPALVPQFVTADRPHVGPYRILLLAADDGSVAWDIVSAQGPSMIDFGARSDTDLLDLVDRAVAGAVGGADLRAGAQLGLANVRYVVVSDLEPAPDLIQALGRQPALEPLPSGGGRVFSVESWLPRAVVLPPARGEELLTTGYPEPVGDLEQAGLQQLRRDLYVAREPAEEGGLLVVSESTSTQWRAVADGRALERRELEGVNAFAVPPGSGVVRARVGIGFGHRLVVALQLLLLLAVISLGLRPPGLRTRAQRAETRSLPAELASSEPVQDNPQGVAP